MYGLYLPLCYLQTLPVLRCTDYTYPFVIFKLFLSFDVRIILTPLLSSNSSCPSIYGLYLPLCYLQTLPVLRCTDYTYPFVIFKLFLSFDVRIILTPLLSSNSSCPSMYGLYLPLCYLQTLPVLLRCTDYTYPFVIFKLFLSFDVRIILTPLLSASSSCPSMYGLYIPLCYLQTLPVLRCTDYTYPFVICKLFLSFDVRIIHTPLLSSNSSCPSMHGLYLPLCYLQALPVLRCTDYTYPFVIFKLFLSFDVRIILTPLLSSNSSCPSMYGLYLPLCYLQTLPVLRCTDYTYPFVIFKLFLSFDVRIILTPLLSSNSSCPSMYGLYLPLCYLQTLPVLRCTDYTYPFVIFKLFLSFDVRIILTPLLSSNSSCLSMYGLYLPLCYLQALPVLRCTDYTYPFVIFKLFLSFDVRIIPTPLLSSNSSCPSMYGLYLPFVICKLFLSFDVRIIHTPLLSSNSSCPSMYGLYLPLCYLQALPVLRCTDYTYPFVIFKLFLSFDVQIILTPLLSSNSSCPSMYGLYLPLCYLQTLPVLRCTDYTYPFVIFKLFLSFDVRIILTPLLSSNSSCPSMYGLYLPLCYLQTLPVLRCTDYTYPFVIFKLFLSFDVRIILTPLLSSNSSCLSMYGLYLPLCYLQALPVLRCTDYTYPFVIFKLFLSFDVRIIPTPLLSSNSSCPSMYGLYLPLCYLQALPVLRRTGYTYPFVIFKLFLSFDILIILTPLLSSSSSCPSMYGLYLPLCYLQTLPVLRCTDYTYPFVIFKLFLSFDVRVILTPLLSSSSSCPSIYRLCLPLCYLQALPVLRCTGYTYPFVIFKLFLSFDVRDILTPLLSSNSSCPSMYGLYLPLCYLQTLPVLRCTGYTYPFAIFKLFLSFDVRLYLPLCYLQTLPVLRCTGYTYPFVIFKLFLSFDVRVILTPLLSSNSSCPSMYGLYLPLCYLQTLPVLRCTDYTTPLLSASSSCPSMYGLYIPLCYLQTLPVLRCTDYTYPFVICKLFLSFDVRIIHTPLLSSSSSCPSMYGLYLPLCYLQTLPVLRCTDYTYPFVIFKLFLSFDVRIILTPLLSSNSSCPSMYGLYLPLCYLQTLPVLRCTDYTYPFVIFKLFLSFDVRIILTPLLSASSSCPSMYGLYLPLCYLQALPVLRCTDYTYPFVFFKLFLSFDVRIILTPLLSSSSSCPSTYGLYLPLCYLQALPVLRYTDYTYPFVIFKLFLSFDVRVILTPLLSSNSSCPSMYGLYLPLCYLQTLPVLRCTGYTYPFVIFKLFLSFDIQIMLTPLLSSSSSCPSMYGLYLPLCYLQALPVLRCTGYTYPFVIFKLFLSFDVRVILTPLLSSNSSCPSMYGLYLPLCYLQALPVLRCTGYTYPFVIFKLFLSFDVRVILTPLLSSNSSCPSMYGLYLPLCYLQTLPVLRCTDYTYPFVIFKLFLSFDVRVILTPLLSSNSSCPSMYRLYLPLCYLQTLPVLRCTGYTYPFAIFKLFLSFDVRVILTPLLSSNSSCPSMYGLYLPLCYLQTLPVLRCTGYTHPFVIFKLFLSL